MLISTFTFGGCRICIVEAERSGEVVEAPGEPAEAQMLDAEVDRGVRLGGVDDVVGGGGGADERQRQEEKGQERPGKLHAEYSI